MWSFLEGLGDVPGCGGLADSCRVLPTRVGIDDGEVETTALTRGQPATLDRLLKARVLGDQRYELDAQRKLLAGGGPRLRLFFYHIIGAHYYKTIEVEAGTTCGQVIPMTLPEDYVPDQDQIGAFSVTICPMDASEFSRPEWRVSGPTEDAEIEGCIRAFQEPSPKGTLAGAGHKDAMTQRLVTLLDAHLVDSPLGPLQSKGVHLLVIFEYHCTLSGSDPLKVIESEGETANGSS